MKMKKKKHVLCKIILCIILIIGVSFSVNIVKYLQSPYMSRRQSSGSVGHFKNTNALKFNLSLFLINVKLPNVLNDKKYNYEDFDCYFYSNFCRYNPITMTFRPRTLRRFSSISLIYTDNQIDNKYSYSNKYYCNTVDIYADDYFNEYHRKVKINYKNITNPCAKDCTEEFKTHIYYQIESEILYRNDRYIITVYSTDPDYDTELLNSEYDGIVASLV